MRPTPPRRSACALAPWLLLGIGCSEYGVREGDPVPVADPPGREIDAQGDPPDWSSCAEGYWGHYSNLPADHPDVTPPEEASPPDPDAVDWWDSPAFSRFDPSLELGEPWWPLDEGLEGDPAWFAVQWFAWVRVTEREPVELLLGSADDAWVWLDEELVVSQPGLHPFETQRVTLDPGPGQFPLELRMAHRGEGSAGFRFRIVRGEATVCMPEYGG